MNNTCPRCKDLPDDVLWAAISNYAQEERRKENARKEHEKWWEVNKERILAERAEIANKQNQEYYKFIQFLLSSGLELTTAEKKFCEYWEGKCNTH